MADFLQCKARNAVNPNGLTSILTRQCDKSACKKRIRITLACLSENHCPECLKLDGCYFLKEKTPPHPHHPYCHCLLNFISYNTVLKNAKAVSDYSKYDPYLFNPEGKYPHNKEKLFKSWGYTISDAKWLQKEIERQAIEKYINGDYVLGKLDKEGQRISIRVEISRKDKESTVSFITGWMIYPNGKIQLTTPYGGK